MKRICLLVLLIPHLFIACEEDPGPLNPVIPEQNVLEFMDSRLEFSVFREAVRQAGLDSTFTTIRPFSVFIPGNRNFADENIVLSALTEVQTANLVLNHIVDDSLTIFDLPAEGIVPSVRNEDLIFRINRVGTFVDNFNFEEVPARQSNGFVYRLDGVLAPVTQTVGQTITRLTQFSNFDSLVQFVPSLLDSLNSSTQSFTVFVPENVPILEEAEIPDFLRTYIVAGQVYSFQLTEQNATLNGQLLQIVDGNRLVKTDPVTQATDTVNAATLDLKATNGVIHQLAASFAL